MLRFGKTFSRSSGNSSLKRLGAIALAASMIGIFLTPVWGDQTGQDKNKKGQLSKAAAEAKVIALIEQARKVESNGDMAGRNDLLDQAAEIAGTSNPTLNSLRGLVLYENGWHRPEAISLDPKFKATLAQYRKLRDGSPDSLQTWIELARWCQLNGLPSEFRANLKRVLEADPENAMARQALGHSRIDDRWVSPEQMVKEVIAIREATERFLIWEKRIRKIGTRMADTARKNRDKGVSELRSIEDPNVITAMEVILGSHSESIALEAIDNIGRFREREAAESLLRLALESPWNSCRDRAIKHLRKREVFEVVPRLIGMLETPVTSAFVMVPDSRGNLLHRHVFKQEGIDRDFVRQLDNFIFEWNTNGIVSQLRNPSVTEAGKFAVDQAASLEVQKEQHNTRSAARNQKLQGVLGKLTGQYPGSEAKDWMQWWYDYNEVKVYEKSVSYRRDENYQGVYNPYVPAPRSRANSAQPSGFNSARTNSGQRPRSCECFVKGTLVTTETGLVSIETVRTGDKVLSRNTENGQLEFRPVIQPTVRESSPTLKIKVGNELFQCSKGHPFWIADQGWVHARDLKLGQRIVKLDGSQPIEAIEDGDNQVLYNLIVEANSSYFVGKGRFLCHDNTIQQQGSRTIANRLTR